MQEVCIEQVSFMTGVKEISKNKFDLVGVQSPIQRVPGALSQGVKRLGHETAHTPPTSAEVEKIWIYTSIPSHAFMA
jgi:hypothetical protein